jgi:hypothetical protein
MPASQLSQARFQPQLAVKPLGPHGLVHEINHRAPLPATTPLHETNVPVSDTADFGSFEPPVNRRKAW